MPDLKDGETARMQGSGREPYTLKNIGGVYSCNCMAWRNQSLPIERRTCKHLRKMRGDAAEQARVGQALSVTTTAKSRATPPGLLLAETWQESVDPTGWLISEKLDGARAWWNGTGFVSRQGNRFHAPDWFTAGLPNVPLDGELWLGRKAFQRTMSIIRRQDQPPSWREIRFVVFDAPAINEPFERRVKYVREALAEQKSEYAVPLPHYACRDREHLQTELNRIAALGGEGLMLREPGSFYEARRSATLLKVKRFHDAEARVIDHQPGKGRHKGRLGALVVQLADGTQFSVGTGLSDAERESPPAVGSLITFRYQELSDGGVPRFPSFVRVQPE